MRLYGALTATVLLPGCLFGYATGVWVSRVSDRDDRWDTWGRWDSWDRWDSGTEACAQAELQSVWPEDGHTRVYPWTTVLAHFGGQDPFRWLDIPEAWSEGLYWASYDDSGTRVEARLDGPLTPNTSYTVTISTCAGYTEAEFTTAAVGGDVVDAVALAGRTWRLDRDEARIIHPWSLNDLLQGLSTQPMRFTLVDDGAGGLVPRMSWEGEDGAEQDWCVPSTDWPEMSLTENPYTTGLSEALTLATPALSVGEGVDLPMESVWMEGAFSQDGVRWAGELWAWVDARGLTTLLEVDADGVCALVSATGADCELCADGQPYCFPLGVAGLFATEVSAASPVEQVRERDCDARCPASADNPDCGG